MANQSMQLNDHYGIAHIGSLAVEGILGQERSSASEFNSKVAERLLYPSLCLGPIVGIDVKLVTSLESTGKRAEIIQNLAKKRIIQDADIFRIDVTKKRDHKKVFSAQ